MAVSVPLPLIVLAAFLLCPGLPGVDGYWGEWSAWGPCSVSCGNHGLRIRTRTCYGSAPCQGSCADTGPCHLQHCPRRAIATKSCVLNERGVRTFTGLEHPVLYPCLFRAATLGPFHVAGGHKLKLDIFAAYKDGGGTPVSHVKIVVTEHCLHPSPRITSFSVNASFVEQVQSGNRTEDDLWEKSDENAYRDYFCFGYNNGLVSFSFRRSSTSVCTQVLAFRVTEQYGHTFGSFSLTVLPPLLHISVKETILPKASRAQFPHTLCSGRHDKGFMRHVKGLATDQQKIFYGLLAQDVEQLDDFFFSQRCDSVVRDFRESSADGKKRFAEQCVSGNPEDVFNCNSTATPP